MAERRDLVVRDTPIHLLTAGRGAPLLYLHSAGGAGRWLGFQERLAERFAVSFPSHPGHGGSPPAEWIEHVSDLAFHYLDLLDTLGLERVHLVGASFGGWIGAEMATMASHRLASLVLIDPVGIKVDGWIYPFLFGMDLPQIVATVFHDPMNAIQLAPKDGSIDTLGLERVHLVGASFGGWIGAEMATMASHRLASLVLIDPVGIKVEGWIYPFLFGMDLPQIVMTVFHDPANAIPLAPKDGSIDTLAELYRQQTALARVGWNPYLYNPLLRRRLARITAPTLLCWGRHDRLAPLQCAEAWRKEIPAAELRIFEQSGHAPHLEEPDAVAAAVAEFCGRGATR